MSVKRSVQSAQRRRVGAPESAPKSAYPQPSINSAQLFANQARSGPGPNIPSGRLAGQQAALQQQQMQQNIAKENKEGLASVNKMTISQAITLITLRLGAIETKLIHGDKSGMSNMDNTDILQTIMERLDDLEKQPNEHTDSGSAAVSVELGLMKQNMEVMKQSLAQNKGIKEVTNLKNKVEELTNELKQTKELLAVLQNVVLENSQKILELTIGADSGEYEFENGDGDGNDEGADLDVDESNELVGNDLKEIIENELKMN